MEHNVNAHFAKISFITQYFNYNNFLSIAVVTSS